jgi:hypothetical protein
MVNASGDTAAVPITEPTVNPKADASTIADADKIADAANTYKYLVLDNIEIIFSEHLQIDPLGVLKNISKYQETITAWPGYIKDGYLTYAEPWHKDYVKYSLNELECLYMNLE